MEPTCARCGAALTAVGRFCTNCGAPREAEDPRVVPAVPPPVHQAPPPQRFPLYADEDPPGAGTAPLPVVPGGPATAAPDPGGRHRRARWLPWLVLGALVVVLGLVAASLLGGDDRPGDAASAGAPSGGDAGAANPPTGEPEDLAGRATARAPRSDADSVDIATGLPTTYEPANMLDGDPTTGWRVTGDATGDTLTFTFDEPVTLSAVGLVNGYAKTSVDGSGTEFDLYAGSRRVLEVEWVLDGGDPIPQTLVDGDREVQLLDVGAVEASTVELRLVGVSAPGTGPGARDKTAISEVALRGYAG